MNDTVTRPWLALFGLCLGMCVTNGFARFAYGLILPAMRQDLGWTYAQAGWLNTANALGYLTGAVVTLILITRINASMLYAIGMVTTAVSLLLTGLNEALWWQTIWRVAAGLFGAMSFATSGALAAQLFAGDPKRNALAIALLFGLGGGLGISLAGAMIPPLLINGGITAWPHAWTLIGVCSLLFLPLGVWAGWTLRPRATTGPRTHTTLPLRRMWPELVGYGSFGMGYIVYFTFLGSWMKTQATGPVLSALAWVLLGLCLTISPFLWGGVFSRFRNGVPLAMVLTGIAVGTLTPVMWPTDIGLAVSAILFGFCVFMSPSAITNFTRHNLPPESWAASIGLFTVIFATTQTVGPIAAGWIGDVTGDIGNALRAAAGVLFWGAAFACLQRPIER